ncbi:heme o synthase [Rhodococcus sp. X156]|uniref:heme o synthase n=1 Tax=Rhodococcus sp. X156 TaxID=2499145 RepID=UPI000FD6D58A|nr:heme o synthase [Rhodococcus sp. X156]
MRTAERTSRAQATPGPGHGAGQRLRAKVGAYVGLTKPRVIELLLVTTIPAMLLAQRGVDPLPLPLPLLVLTTLFGGMLAAASANTLNCVADADIDKVMKRTARRALARETVPTRHALVFGLALGVLSFFWLWATTNLFAGVLAVATILFYVLVYTLVLKRRTTQNVVWGGAAGCMPVVIGWAAVTGTVEWPAAVMFGIIFFWTPPHTWALAMRYKEDYRAAGVPMLPVVATAQEVTRKIVLFSWVMVAVSLLLLPATGWLYAAVAVLTGAWFLVMAHRLYAATKAGRQTNPMKLFHLSNTYLSLLFIGIAVDSVLNLPTLL